MRTILILALGMLCSAPAWAQNKVYAGPEGESVAVIPLTGKAAEEGAQYLLFVQGTGSEFDGKALPHTLNEWNRNADYTTQYRGEGFNTLIMRDSRGSRRYDLYVPGRRDAIRVSFDEKRTQALKPEEIISLYQKHKADGSLAKLAAFNRPERESGHVQRLAEELKAANAACGTQITAAVDWKSVSDEVLKRYSISSYCANPLDALRRLCESPVARKFIQPRVKQLTCQFGPEMKLTLDAQGVMRWITDVDAGNQDEFAKKFFLQNLSAGSAPSASASASASQGLELPWGRGQTLGEQLQLERTSLCTDGKGHYVVVAPRPQEHALLFYGDGKSFVQVTPPPWVLSGTHFLEPRFVLETANRNFRGLDMRVYSEVTVNAEKKVCEVRCGKRTVDFPLVEGDKAWAQILAARYEPNPQQYVPYALLRDTHGVYYFVERGARPDNEKSFRVHMGLKGNLKLQEMKDIVSDSEGQIFSTKKGELRLVLERADSSQWIERSKRTELRSVPVAENMPLIYNELGVYAGARLGTPCDDQ